jgi:single-stranded-DNA-specific exonuclease
MYVRQSHAEISRVSSTRERPAWVEPASIPPDQPRLHPDQLLHDILSRRIGDPDAVRAFLDASPRPAPDPLAMPGMAEATARVAHALRGGEPIGVFGDYDTDGVTSAALLTLALRAASGGAQPVAVRLPRRHEGYGLSLAGVDDLADAGAHLLIAVDCGSKDFAALAHARQRGLDVVVLDHHQIADELPSDAIVASAQVRPDAPYRDASAAGIAYFLATALAMTGIDAGGGVGQEPTVLLDLAMIGLVGDVSSLMGVNRPIVRDGLRRLREGPRVGLQALCEVARIAPMTLTSGDIAFQVSPRLNAPGRLDDPRPAYDLLVSADRRAALRLAETVELANRQRKVRQEHILRDVEAMLTAQPMRLERRVLVFSGRGWEAGVVGLAAGKLAERFRRPVVVLSVDGGVAHGSARSVEGFDVTRALDDSADLLIRHGGHSRAAGLALEASRVAELDDALQEAIAASEALPPGPPQLRIDADLAPERLGIETARLIQRLGPFGEGNPVPLLRIRGLPIRAYATMGREHQHLKLLTEGATGVVDAILWSGADRSRELLGLRRVDIAGYLETNVWNGTQRAQMRIADFKPTEG